jgi:hypothetical protein
MFSWRLDSSAGHLFEGFLRLSQQPLAVPRLPTLIGRPRRVFAPDWSTHSEPCDSDSVRRFEDTYRFRAQGGRISLGLFTAYFFVLTLPFLGSDVFPELSFAAVLEDRVFSFI